MSNDASADPKANPKKSDDDALLVQWVNELKPALADAGVDTGDLAVNIDRVLGLAGHAAHSVARPAAPLTTFIVGFAAGRAAAGERPADEAVDAATQAALELTRAHRDGA